MAVERVRRAIPLAQLEGFFEARWALEMTYDSRALKVVTTFRSSALSVFAEA